MSQTTTGSGVERLFAAGAHFAHVKSRRHPSMKTYIAGSKSRVEIIDLAKTDAQLTAAKAAMETLAKDGKTVLFVGGKKEIAELVKQAAERIGAPYVSTRWLGGTVSNFPEIKKRIDRRATLVEQRASGELAKRYTKLERLRLDREIDRLTERLDGITGLAKRPDVMLIVDTKHEAHAAKEAREAGIPVIGIINSDCNVADAAYPIVANDASRATVSLILDELTAAYAKGRTA
ncbi:MAG TPA: 30S ribosomal protein S2 [Candidatus Paceibacterota bacterium]